MKLALINESSFKNKVKAALMAGGLPGVVKEFDVDFATASKYLQMFKSGHYGEDDIYDKVLHRMRAPQCVLKLLRHFDVSPAIIRKIVSFYSENRVVVASHRPSPDDSEAIRQLQGGERLAASLAMPKEKLESLGFVAELVPWYDTDASFKQGYPNGIFYVAAPENQDVLREIIGAYGNKQKSDLLHGLAFGYKMSDVMNYIRSANKDLVDGLCGNVDTLGR